MTVVLTAISIGVSVLTLIWNVVTQARASSSRKFADQADRAGRILDRLQILDLGGTDAGLDQQAVRVQHDKQVEDLRRVIRISARGFTERALRPQTSRTLITIFITYGVLLAVFSGTAFSSLTSATPGRSVPTTIIAVTFAVAGVTLLVVGTAAARGRMVATNRMRAAGLRTPTVWQEINDTMGWFRNRAAVAALRRRQRR